MLLVGNSLVDDGFKSVCCVGEGGGGEGEEFTQ